jgi:nicotinamidase-related amidase
MTFEGRLNIDDALVLIIDAQQRLAAAMPERQSARALWRIGQLVEAADLLGLPVVVTEQYPKGLGPTVQSVREALETLSTPAFTYEKLEFDVMQNGVIATAIRDTKRTQVITVGMEAHICVYQSARGLIGQGYEAIIPVDATCSRDPESRRIAEGLWLAAGARVSNTEAVLFDLLGRAGGDAFKNISKMLRPVDPPQN